MISTPRKPTPIAAQRRGPTVSDRKKYREDSDHHRTDEEDRGRVGDRHGGKRKEERHVGAKQEATAQQVYPGRRVRSCTQPAGQRHD
jgi:hypothetical protein